MLARQGGNYRKLVYGCRASGSALPFPSNWFTAYVSNLVLQLIDSPEDQIREAYRVLKPDSVAAFTVWGRKENSMLFTAQGEAERRRKEKAGQAVGKAFPPEGPNSLSNFAFGYNIDRFLSVFRKAGFNQTKHWFQL